MKEKICLYTRFERLWHWLQALLIIMLLVTGFNIHGTINLMTFKKAHEVHMFCGWTLLILTAFAIFWHLTTGEWRQYVPTKENLDRVCRYYVCDIFKGEPHPHKKSREAKLNPLQRLAYLFLKIFLLPGVFLSGIWYYLYNQSHPVVSHRPHLPDHHRRYPVELHPGDDHRLGGGGMLSRDGS